MKLENRQCDYAEGKSNGSESLKDLHSQLQARNERMKKKQILMYKIMHYGSVIPLDKHMDEQKL